jgi:AcrR family transcriptional regulator
LFHTREYEDVAIEDIAKASGFAKGTFYLYFHTKEEVFLELVGAELAAWARALSETIRVPAKDQRSLAAVIASSVARRPALVRLVGLMHGVLERNVEAEALRKFKHQLLEIFTGLAEALRQPLGLEHKGAARLLLWIHALVVGLAQMESRSLALEQILAEDEALQIFRIDFEAELGAALGVLLEGMASAKT